MIVNNSARCKCDWVGRLPRLGQGSCQCRVVPPLGSSLLRVISIWETRPRVGLYAAVSRRAWLRPKGKVRRFCMQRRARKHSSAGVGGIHNKRQGGMFGPEPESCWAIFNSTSFVSSLVVMTKPRGPHPLPPIEAFPTVHLPGPTHLHFRRDPWLTPISAMETKYSLDSTTLYLECSSSRTWRISRWNLPSNPGPPTRDSEVRGRCTAVILGLQV